jgi:hypothetical protein
LEDLDESVRAVENAGSRWGMDDGEVIRRRGFVERVTREVKVSPEPGSGASPGTIRGIGDALLISRT